jgi:prepilin-type N-terminal cleavage/methylation domain-containing protein
MIVKERKAFTLIELLVVIAIIALLLAIIMPSLQKVKELASGVVCMSNQKQLALGWTMYASANLDKTVGGECKYATYNDVPPWCMPPLDYDVNGDILPMGDNAGVTFEHRLNGLREGGLPPYLDDPEVFHCSGDKRVARGTSEGTGPWYQIYRSYSMPSGMASNKKALDLRATFGYGPITKADEIKQPSSKYIFVEEAYDGRSQSRNYNDEYWNLIPFGGTDNDYSYQFWDPLAAFHVKSGTFAFADGHTEKHKWVDKEIIDFFENRGTSQTSSFPGSPDFEWLANGFPFAP